MQQMLFARARNALLLSGLLLLSACGGGSSTPATTETDTTPTVTDNTAGNSDTNGDDQSPVVTQVAGKAYLTESGLLVIAEGGHATGYDTDGMTAFTWAVDGDTLTLASAGGTLTFTVSADNTALDGNSAYRLGQPLTLAALDGLYLAETINSAVDDCDARTLSFSGNTLTIREQCGADFDTFSLMLAAVDGVENLLHAYGAVDGETLDVYLALREGDLTDASNWLFASLENGAFNVLESGEFTPVNEPLSMQNTGGEDVAEPQEPANPEPPVGTLENITATLEGDQYVAIITLPEVPFDDADKVSITSVSAGSATPSRGQGAALIVFNPTGMDRAQDSTVNIAYTFDNNGTPKNGTITLDVRKKIEDTDAGNGGNNGDTGGGGGRD